MLCTSTAMGTTRYISHHPDFLIGCIIQIRHVQDRALGFKLKLKIWASPNSRSKSRFATASTQDQDKVQDLASPNSRSSSRFGFLISNI